MHGSLCRRCHKAATTADGRKLWLPVSSAHNVCGIGGLYERRNDAGLHDRHTQYCLCGCQTTFSRIGLMFLVGTALIYGVQFGASAIANAINPDRFPARVTRF